MRKLYLITGATGHLGTALLERLRGTRADIRSLVLPGEEALLGEDIRTVAGNVLDAASLEPFFDTAGYESVTLLHLAAVISIASRANPVVRAVNYLGTRNVLDLALRRGVDRAVYVSSVHAIPEKPAPEVITETRAFSAAAVYGQYAKSKAEAAAAALRAAERGLDLSVVHPSGIIGPGDKRRNNHMVRSIEAMAKGRVPASIRGGYDFVDARDVAEGIVLCEERGRSGECYILSGQYITVRELLRMICEMKRRRAPTLELPGALARALAPMAERLSLAFGVKNPVMTPGSIYTLLSNGRFSHEKATRELGYAPGTSGNPSGTPSGIWRAPELLPF